MLKKFMCFLQGGPGSVRLWFEGGTVRAVLVFGSGGSSVKRFCCVSVQFNRKGRFRFRFLKNGSGGSSSAFGFGKKTPLLNSWFFFGKRHGKPPKKTRRIIFYSEPPKIPVKNARKKKEFIAGEKKKEFHKKNKRKGRTGTVPVPGSGSVPEPP